MRLEFQNPPSINIPRNPTAGASLTLLVVLDAHWADFELQLNPLLINTGSELIGLDLSLVIHWSRVTNKTRAVCDWRLSAPAVPPCPLPVRMIDST